MAPDPGRSRALSTESSAALVALLSRAAPGLVAFFSSLWGRAAPPFLPVIQPHDTDRQSRACRR